MASEMTVFSHDGNWKADIEAWKNNFWIYKSIGCQATVYKKSGSSIWGGSSWGRANARSITIRNLYNGGIAANEGTWNNQSHAELKVFAFGTSLTIPPSTPGSAILIATSVEGIITGFFGNGEGFTGHVLASDKIEDSSIW
jgi:hypothetical protein